MSMQSLKLLNGRMMPILGLGTWTAPPDLLKTAIDTALKAGYRHFDCAYFYDNEKDIGEALKQGMRKQYVSREQLFVTSKTWPTHMRPKLVKESCKRTLKDLQLSYLDLFLVHWPVALKSGGPHFPLAADGKTYAVDDVPLSETWKAMEDLIDEGAVKSIGLSNFNRRQIDLIMKEGRIKPVNLQIEANANFPNTKLVEYAQSLGLTVSAYAPLGSPGGEGDFRKPTNLLTAPWVLSIARKHGKTAGQVLLRYLIQRRIIVLPKSTTPSRIKENSQIFDFELTDEEMDALNKQGTHERQFKMEGMMQSKEYPFNDEF